MIQDALTQFASTGRTSDHMPMLRPFTVAERVSILEALLLNCKENPWFEIYLRKDDMLKDYNICCYSGRGIYMSLKNASYVIENSPELLLTPPASFYTLFETYYRKELIRNHCYSAAESMEKLETILWNLKCM